MAINCAALPESLLESELFGYEEGSFTGAAKGGKPGLFEIAHNGTLFLDEIGDMPVSIQARLLRVLEEKAIMPIGKARKIPINVRVICATNRDVTQLLRQKLFREDLFYRINTLSLHIPPLRERRRDIPALARFYLDATAKDLGVTHAAMERDALAVLEKYDFPGNVRELRNMVERLLVTARGGVIDADAVAALAGGANTETAAAFPEKSGPKTGLIREQERVLILQTLAACDNNKARCAAVLGISQATLWRKLRSLEPAGSHEHLKG